MAAGLPREPAPGGFDGVPEVAPGHGYRAYPRPDDGLAALPFRVRYRMLHAQVCAKGHRAGRHRHPHYELLVPHQGRYACLLDGLPATAVPGQAVLVRPGGWHEDHCPGPLRFHALTIEAEPGPAPGLSADILAGPVDPRRQVLDDGGGRLRALCLRIADAAARGGATAALVLDALAAEVLAELLRAMPAEALAPELAAA
ncbi:MAG: cupin domain-containing protein, partial [Planctomycetes bacterium]|nr:cupin domain-containing protein [Planctomycetota bacterium]